MGRRDFDALQTKRFDLVVVGGGIYGATMAWEASSRGLSVALFEKQDFGHATSANSLKLIHGGIRYLQHLDIRRLRESVRERRALLRIAPHLVTPLQCLFPTGSTLTENALTVGTAFHLYNILSKNRNQNIDPSRHISGAGWMNRKKMLDLWPDLEKLDCSGVGYWYDAQAHNTERLVLSFVLSAVEEGARAFNYAMVTQLLREGDGINGVVVRDSLSNICHEIHADSVIDCTGPWSKWHAESRQKLRKSVFVKAVNLVVKKPLFACGLSLKVTHENAEGSSSRQLFLVPWRGRSLLGTWYFPAADGPEHVFPTEQEFDTCLRQANSVLPGRQIDRSDVTAVHAGLLPAEPSEDIASEPILKSKASIIDASDGGGPKGLYFVQGVKFTTARSVAQSTIDRVCHLQRKNVRQSETASRPLYGGNLGEVDSYYQQKITRLSNSLSAKVVTRLIDNYGTNIEMIMQYISEDESLRHPVPGTTELLRAELVFVLEHEMVVTLSDLLLRRLDLGALGMPAQETIAFCSEFLGRRMGWDEKTRLENIVSLTESYYPLCRTVH